jgi:methylmalonyl-CoA/ethylmalonyl-CoA epimerase
VFEHLDHVGIAVPDLDDALGLYLDTFGMSLLHREVIAEQGVEAAILGVGRGHIELLAPLSGDSPVGRFMAKRGPGMHHLAYQVADVDAALAELRLREIELIDAVPRVGIRSSRVAFLHPRATRGVLTELVEHR